MHGNACKVYFYQFNVFLICNNLKILSCCTSTYVYNSNYVKEQRWVG